MLQPLWFQKPRTLPTSAVSGVQSKQALVSASAPLAKDRFQPADKGKRILIVSETYGQINGVSTTIKNLVNQLEKQKYQVEVLYPALFPTIPTSYPDMRVSNPFGLKNRVKNKIEKFQPERIFILTEGPLGWATKNYCKRNQIPYSTSYSIKWDDCLKTQLHIPSRMTRKMLKSFHRRAESVLAITPSLLEDLKRQGYKNLVLWRQAVDTERFKPLSEDERLAFESRPELKGKPRPFYLYVGRVSTEKNIEAFLKADLPGTKIIVGPEGAGLSLEKMKKRYPDAVFTGPKHGDELGSFYGGSDVFVFPSKADTLGLVMLEALSAGLPVVGYNVTGPKDVLEPDSNVGFLAENDAELQKNALRAWRGLQSGEISRQSCREAALQFSWPNCINTMLSNLKIFNWDKRAKESVSPDANR